MNAARDSALDHPKGYMENPRARQMLAVSKRVAHSRGSAQNGLLLGPPEKAFASARRAEESSFQSKTLMTSDCQKADIAGSRTETSRKMANPPQCQSERCQHHARCYRHQQSAGKPSSGAASGTGPMREQGRPRIAVLRAINSWMSLMSCKAMRLLYRQLAESYLVRTIALCFFTACLSAAAAIHMVRQTLITNFEEHNIGY